MHAYIHECKQIFIHMNASMMSPNDFSRRLGTGPCTRSSSTWIRTKCSSSSTIKTSSTKWMPPVDRRRPREVLGRCRHEAACGGRRPALHPDLGLSLARPLSPNISLSRSLSLYPSIPLSLSSSFHLFFFPPLHSLLSVAPSLLSVSLSLSLSRVCVRECVHVFSVFVYLSNCYRSFRSRLEEDDDEDYFNQEDDEEDEHGPPRPSGLINDPGRNTDTLQENKEPEAPTGLAALGRRH